MIYITINMMPEGMEMLHYTYQIMLHYTYIVRI